MSMNAEWSQARPVVLFFVLVYTLTVPFWLLSTIVKLEGLPAFTAERPDQF